MKSLNDFNDNVSPTSLLEDLRSNETKVKLNAIKNLNMIAFALGKERTRNELIPFLAGKIFTIFYLIFKVFPTNYF